MADKIYKVRDPSSGEIRLIKGPDDATDEEISYQASKLFGGEDRPIQQVKPRVDTKPFDYKAALQQTARDMPWLERNAAAMVTPFVGGYEAVKELFGKGDPARSQEIKTLQEEAPWGAISGSLVPAVGLASKIPLAATTLGRIVQSASSGIAGGLLTPEGKDQATLYGKGTQALTGGITGGLFGTGLETVKSIGRGLRNVISPAISESGANAAAGRLASVIAGKDSNEIIQLLKSGKIDETAAQAAVKSGNPEFMALESAMRKVNTKQFDIVDKLQNESSTGILNKLARGSSETESIASRNLMKKKLEDQLGVIREKQIQQANIGGQQVQPMLDRAQMLEQQAMQFGGTSAEAVALRAQAQKLINAGYTPIDVGNITNRISSLIDDPKIGSSENVSKVLSSVSNQLTDWVKKGGGTIDADALYMKRKEAINETISSLLSGADPKITSKLAAKVTEHLKPLIDDAMEQAGATGWKAYVSKYGKGLEAIDRVELMDSARKLFASNPKEFAQLVRGENPESIKKIMNGKYDLSTIVSNNTMEKLKSIASNVERDAEVSRLAGIGSQNVRKTMGSFEEPIKPVGLLHRPTMLFNEALRRIEGKGGQRIESQLSELMLPQNKALLAELMAKASPSQRAILINNIANISGGYSSGMLTGNNQSGEQQ